jgi:uncharacterized protein YndB with AHSA1/START domain
MSTAVASDLKLQIHRTYKATPQAIFEAWIQPELIQQWFGGCSSSTFVGASTDPRLGGAYSLSMEGPSPSDPGTSRLAVASGIYTAFEPGKLLAFTWNGSWQPDEESLVTISLNPVEGGTELLLTHERFLTEASRDGHNRGWIGGLDGMDKLFERL